MIKFFKNFLKLHFEWHIVRITCDNIVKPILSFYFSVTSILKNLLHIFLYWVWIKPTQCNTVVAKKKLFLKLKFVYKSRKS